MQRKILTAVALTFALVASVLAVPSEHAVSDPVYIAAPAYQDNPLIASDGQNFLAVWHDQRAYPYVMYAARVNARGELLDPTGIRIPTFAYPTAVVFAGDAYMVLWNEERGVYAARISRDGKLIEAKRLLIQNMGINAAASNGSRIVVARRDRFAVLDAEGQLLARDIPLPVDQFPDVGPRVVSNGSRFLITFWNSYGQPALQTMALDASGGRIGTVGTIATNAGLDFSAASNGRDYLVVYSNMTTGSVESRAVSSDGTPLGSPFRLSSIPLGVAMVPMAWNGSRYAFFLRGGVSAQSGWPQAVRRAQLDVQGKPVDDLAPVAGAWEVAMLAAASNGHDVMLAWRGRQVYTDDDNIYAGSGSSVDDPTASGTLLSRSAVPQIAPDIAFSGRNYLVARLEQSSLSINRILLNGDHLDGSGVPLDRALVTAKPRALFDGENYIVAWIGSEPSVHIARLQPDSGAIIGAVRVLAQSKGATSLDVAFDGQSFVTVWTDGHLHAARLGRDLQVLDVRHDLAPADMAAGAPSLAWNGSEWLVAFDELFFCAACLSPFNGPMKENVRAVRLSSSLNLLDPQPMVVAADDIESNTTAHVASNGDDFAVIWTRVFPGGARVQARHLRNGTFVDDAAWIANGNASSLIWDGIRYAAAFTDGGDAFLTHLGAGDVQIITATPDDESAPRLVAVEKGGVAAVYVRLATEPLYGGVPRAFMRQPGPARQRPARR